MLARTLVLAMLALGTLVVGPAAGPALATPPGCDPDQPCDPPPMDPLGPLRGTLDLLVCKIRYHVLHQSCA